MDVLCSLKANVVLLAVRVDDFDLRVQSSCLSTSGDCFRHVPTPPTAMFQVTGATGTPQAGRHVSRIRTEGRRK